MGALSQRWDKSAYVVSDDGALADKLRNALSEDETACHVLRRLADLTDAHCSADLLIVDVRRLTGAECETVLTEISNARTESLIVLYAAGEANAPAAYIRLGAADAIQWPTAKRLLYYRLSMRLQESIARQISEGKPRYRQAAITAPAIARPKRSTRTALTVAVVEDCADVRLSVMRALQTEGFNVRTFTDGRAAARTLRYFPAHLVIIDIMMPRMDGFALLAELRKHGNIAAIFLTERDAENDQLIGLRLGADDYVAKPPSMRILMARVKAVLRRCGFGC